MKDDVYGWTVHDLYNNITSAVPAMVSTRYVHSLPNFLDYTVKDDVYGWTVHDLHNNITSAIPAMVSARYVHSLIICRPSLQITGFVYGKLRFYLK